MKNELTIAAFAKVANTTKDTLVHYDHKNIFKPYRREANGYRYYQLSQLNIFFMIQVYRDMGYTIPEIQSIFIDDSLEKSYKKHRIELTKRLDQARHSLETTQTMFEERERYQSTFRRFQMNKIYIKPFNLNLFYTHPEFVEDDNFYDIVSELRHQEPGDPILSWMIGLKINCENNQSQLIIPYKFSQENTRNTMCALEVTLGSFEDLDVMVTQFVERVSEKNVIATSDVYALQIEDEILNGPQGVSKFLLLLPIENTAL